MPHLRQNLFWAVCLCEALSPAFTYADQTVATPVTPPLTTRDRIAELVEALGDPEFSLRVRAQDELERIGLVAFDQLHKARSHPDIEIRMRVRYLVRSLRVQWVQVSDSQNVRELLRDYEKSTDRVKQARMVKLAALPNTQGAAALCRLLRFEESDRLSRHATLLLLRQTVSDSEPARCQLADLIRSTIEKSERDTSVWARAYADHLLRSSPDYQRWQDIVTVELDVLSGQAERSTPTIVRELIRWHAVTLLQYENRDQALLAMERLFELPNESPAWILEDVDWVMERKAWRVVDKAALRHSKAFEDNAMLMYRRAESYQRRDDLAKANVMADQAFARTGRILKNSAEEQRFQVMLVALSLQQRGFVDWSIREYQQLLSAGVEESRINVRTRILVSELLHDQGRERQAAQSLEPLTKALDSNDRVKQLIVRELQRDPGSIRSRMHYFHACHAKEQRKFEEELSRLRQGIQQDPTDADVLIAMYRVADADEAWKKRTHSAMESAASNFQAQIKKLTEYVEHSHNRTMKSDRSDDLANAHNQYAWLIANTEGDFQDALRSSQKSLELSPGNAGYLDTLGRCYYSLEDLENAIKFQTKAHEAEPHSGQIKKQLDFFRAAAAKKQIEGRKKKYQSR